MNTRIFVVIICIFFVTYLTYYGRSKYSNQIQIYLIILSGIELKKLFNVQLWLVDNMWTAWVLVYLAIPLFAAYYDFYEDPPNKIMVTMAKTVFIWYVMFVIGCIVYTINPNYLNFLYNN